MDLFVITNLFFFGFLIEYLAQNYLNPNQTEFHYLMLNFNDSTLHSFLINSSTLLFQLHMSCCLEIDRF